MGTDSTYGVNVQGSVCGVYGECVNVSPGTSRETPERNTGVCGVGVDYGVFGRGFTTAGVHGENESSGFGVFGVGKDIALGMAGINQVKNPNPNARKIAVGTGIVGATEGGLGFGVVGLSVDSVSPRHVPRAGRDIHNEVVLPTNLSSGIGVLGASDSGTGVAGFSRSGAGVEGKSNSGDGLVGNSDSGIGVVGRSTSGIGGFFTSDFKEAVVGRSGGPSGGVRGSANSGIGVTGEAVTGFGVFGDSAKQSGVVGRSRSNRAPGVFGVCEQMTGVAGRSTSAPGVFGESVRQAGVMGRSTSSAGVFGFGDAPFQVPGVPAGVLGVNDKSVGVLGSSAEVIGVWGNTNRGIGIVGTTDSGEGVPTDRITDQGIGVIGLATSGIGIVGMSTSGTGVFGSSTTGLAGHFKGPVTVEGDITIIGGIKSAPVPHPDGSHTQFYSIESRERWFEDLGESQLVDGNVEVRLESGFTALIEVNSYHIFLTPYGESNGLFVAERYATGFRVSEQQGGTSNVSFAYRVVAKPKDGVANRSAAVTLPEVLSELQLPDLRVITDLQDFERLSISPFDLPGTSMPDKTPSNSSQLGENYGEGQSTD
ncbi:hypothetical protein [Longimicrobium sp.]|uniref:hypothetical protein n=1 Tax=Longimicrobium sp. TaxID=2029185 RepID=UPI002BD025FB|nr:hypothetical protein [Longimicrobium sp.]HSU14095.1 hypothetical protein [Longimicrobium sp.]